MLKTPVRLFLYIFLPLIICGKFYLVAWGTYAHLKPFAPYWAIFLKDALTLGFYVYFLSFAQNRQESFRKLKGPLGWMFGSLILASAVHLLAKSPEQWAQHYLRNVIFFLPLIVVSYTLVIPDRINRLYDVILGTAVFNCVIAVVADLWIPSWVWHERAMAFLADPITLALLLLMALSILLMRFYQTFLRAKSWLLGGLMSLLLIFVIVRTQSLTCLAMLGFLLVGFGLSALVCVVRGGLQRSSFRQQLFVALGGIVAAVGIVTLALNEADLVAKMFAVIQDPWSHGSFQGRAVSYRLLFDFFRSADWLELILGDFRNPSYTRADFSLTGMILNFGLLGTLPLLCGLGYGIKRFAAGFRFSRSADAKIVFGTALLIIGIFVLGGFANSMIYRFPINVILYIVLGAAFRYADDRGRDINPSNGAL